MKLLEKLQIFFLMCRSSIESSNGWYSSCYPANTPRECHFRAWWLLSCQSPRKRHMQQMLEQHTNCIVFKNDLENISPNLGVA